MHKKQGVIAFLGALLTVLVIIQPVTAQPETGITSVPYQQVFGGRIAVEAQINDEGPFLFIVDTAASRSAIFEKARARLGLELLPERFARVYTAFGNQQLPIAGAVTIETAGRSVELPGTIVVPDWEAEESPDGILGLDFLDQYFVYFNVRDRILEIHDEKPRRLPGRFSSVRLSRESIGDDDIPLYFTRLHLSRGNFYAILDTGSVATVLNWAGARRLGISPERLAKERGEMSDALGLTRPVIGLRVSRATLGRKFWRNQTILVADFEIFRIFGRENSPMAILGLDLLNQQDFAIDFAGPRLYIRR